jgi:RHS repeat-associated protein
VTRHKHSWRNCLIITGLLSGLYGNISAQNKPAASTVPAATAITPPAAYTRTDASYVRTWEPGMPIADPATVISSTDVNAVKQATQYFDGLGRPVQTVNKGITPAGKDLVAPVTYDQLGRERYQYLPYIPQSDNINDGKLKTDPFNAQSKFYSDTKLNTGISGQSIYYSQTEYEASPLGRVSKTYAPGNTWAKEGGNKPVEQLYLTNTAADGVRVWDALPGNQAPTSGSGRVYAAGQLYKSVTKDERQLRVIEFKDKEDRVVLKKVELTANAADGHTGWLCTYYVYDDAGNLRWVIPPLAVERIMSTWVIDATTAAGLCFYYRYDGRNRMVAKKEPGADSTEMVYDLRNRLVFKRDGNLKKTDQPGGAKWLVTFYDALDRPTMTALYNSAATRDALQAGMNTAVSNTQNISYTFPKTDLVINSYDGVTHNYQATNSISIENGFDSGTGAEILAEINSAANEGTTSIIASNPLPNIPASALTPLTYTFYDNYGFTGAHAAQTSDFSKPLAVTDLENGSTPYPEPITGVSNMTRGLLTGTKARVLGTDQWLTTTTYYNDKGRILQVISDNMGGGQDVTTNLYDFSGKLLSYYLRHRNLRSSATASQLTVLNMLVYDHAGRLKAVKKRLNEAPASEDKTIVINAYDELGRIKTKRLGIKPDKTQWETLNYDYNIRGWLLNINKQFVDDAANTANWFGQALSYDAGFTVNQYNGNIAGIRWKSRGDNTIRAYGYAYDNASRLTTADFTQQNTAGAQWTQDQKDFSVKDLSYDANGNIMSMKQRGMNGTQIQTLDSLKYGYVTGTNKLAFVTDRKNNTASLLGDFKEITNNESVDYDYDANGNLVKDLNRNITAITYNHLNLPENITVSGKGSVKYLYDAAGNKLRKTVTDNTSAQQKVTVTDYMEAAVYENDILQFVSHEEGRIRALFQAGQPVRFFYDYLIKDHLDNVRMVLTEQTDLSVYTATMEASSSATESALFSNIEETRTAKPVGYPQDQTTKDNQYVAKLNARDGGKKIGPSLVLKVMAGDTIQIGARAFYKSTGPKNNSSVTPEDIVTSLLQSLGGTAFSNGSHGGREIERIAPLGNFSGNDYRRLKEKDPGQNQPDMPKAYLNFVLFDEQFNLVEENSGVRQVKGEPDQLQTLAVDKMAVKKSGFMYIYTSNETAQDVLFDNVTIAAISGPLLEETHYYPFGLTMAGISSNALKGTNYVENRKKYNGNELQSKEFRDGSGLELYDFNARTYDQQIGRFIQVDPSADKGNQESLSPYHFSRNDPARYNDPSGECPNCVTAAIGALVEGGIELGGQLLSGKSLSEVDWVDVGVEATKGALTGFGAGAVVRVAAEIGGEAIKAGVDYSASDGLKTVTNGSKSYGEATIDFTIGGLGGALGGGLANKVTKATNKAVATTSKQAYQAAKAVTKAEAKAAKEIAKSGGYGVAATVKKQAVTAAKVTAQNANVKHAAAKVVSQVAPNATKTTANAVENVAQDKTKVALGVTKE